MSPSNSLIYWQADSGNLVLPEPFRWGKNVTEGVLVWGLCTGRHVLRVLWGYGLSTSSQEMDLWIVRTSAQCSQTTRNVMLVHEVKDSRITLQIFKILSCKWVKHHGTWHTVFRIRFWETEIGISTSKRTESIGKLRAMRTWEENLQRWGCLGLKLLRKESLVSIPWN